MSASVEVQCVLKSVDSLLESLSELNLANSDLRELSEEKRKMKNCHGQEIQIDFLVKNEHGEKIGIKKNEEGHYDLVLEKETATAKATAQKIAQTYARLKILSEVRNKGYQKVKEEKLPNGSIRLVVEKWR